MTPAVGTMLAKCCAAAPSTFAVRGQKTALRWPSGLACNGVFPMKRFLAPVALALLVGAGPACAADVSQADLMQAAVDLGHRYDSNYAAKDPAAMAALYAADGILVSPSGPVVRGRDALKAYYVKRFESGARGHAIKVGEVHVQGDGGYSLISFSVTVPNARGELHEEHGSIVAIYGHDPDGWHLRLVQPSVPPAKES
jgi:uncharacterized protein (TIGR02246 family)